MRKAAFYLMVFTILSNILGFVKDLILSYFYGASEITDVYLIAITIATVIFSFLGSAVTTSYVPMYRNIEINENQYEANKFTNNLLNILLVLITIILILGLIFTREIVIVFAAGFDENTLEKAIEFTRISIFGGYFTVSILLFNAYLRLHNSFLIPAINALIGHIIVIVFIYLSTIGNENMLITGVVISSFIQVCLLFPYLKKHHYSYRFYLDIKNQNIKKTFNVALPVMLSNSIQQINFIVDRTLASLIVVGGISALSYASKINGFVQNIFVLSISHILFPLISKMAASGNIDELKENLQRAIGIISMLVIPATVGVLVLSEPIITFLFGRGAFDEQASLLTSNALFFYAIGMLGSGLREIISKTFYAFQDTKTPMYNAIIALIINVTLSIILSNYMGISGLALATSISALFSALYLYLVLKKKIGELGSLDTLTTLLKITLASTGMGILIYKIYNEIILHINQPLSLIISILIGILSYFIFLLLLRVKELNFLYKRINK